MGTRERYFESYAPCNRRTGEVVSSPVLVTFKDKSSSQCEFAVLSLCFLSILLNVYWSPDRQFPHVLFPSCPALKGVPIIFTDKEIEAWKSIRGHVSTCPRMCSRNIY